MEANCLMWLGRVTVKACKTETLLTAVSFASIADSNSSRQGTSLQADVKLYSVTQLICFTQSIPDGEEVSMLHA